jgi:hypothetical protein
VWISKRNWLAVGLLHEVRKRLNGAGPSSPRWSVTEMICSLYQLANAPSTVRKGSSRDAPAIGVADSYAARDLSRFYAPGVCGGNLY